MLIEIQIYFYQYLFELIVRTNLSFSGAQKTRFLTHVKQGNNDFSTLILFPYGQKEDLYENKVVMDFPARSSCILWMLTNVDVIQGNAAHGFQH